MLSGHQVQSSIGVWFDFASGAERVWLGQGTITTNDGNSWLGMGNLASISGLQTSSMLSVDPVEMTLSGLDSQLMTSVRNQATDIRGRRCGVYLLMADSNWKPLDNPYLIELYLMDKASFTVDGETRTMSVTLVSEPLFSQKHIPATAFITDQDQQYKYSGDKIFERVPLMAGKQTVVWSTST
jgi:hypothetical protein